ncbi:MAG: efflux RND transporter periplasmic adaptor subunit [Anaerolineae bacterium]|nr:efflux RND transporter periplasmic adaptor subunit [Anaerolineae bacterium]
MKNKFRYLILITVVMLTGVSIVGAQTEATNIVDQAMVTTDTLLVTVNATGVVQPQQSVPLTFGMAGAVSEILVDEGDTVQAGDVLARLDAREFELSVRNAEINLQQQQTLFEQLTAPARDVDIAVAQAALNAAQSSANAAYAAQPSSEDLEVARLQEELARNQLWQAQVQRDQTLALNPEFRASKTNDPESQEILLNSSLQQADLGINIAETNYMGLANQGPDMSRLSQANASIVQASIQLEQLLNGPDENDVRMAQIALENSQLAVEQARLQLDEAVLVAPFDGVITTNNLVLGELPPSGQAAMELSNDSTFVVDLLIDETDVVQLSSNQSVNFVLDALPDADISGKVERISLLPMPSSAVPVYQAHVIIDPTSEPLREGMSVTASVVLSEVEDALVVPNRFIRLDSATQQATVTVLENGRTREVAVTLGARNATHSQILSGLQAGQEVVLLDANSLTSSF